MYKEFDDIQNNENVKLAEAYLKNIPIIDVPNWTKELANNQPAINSSIIMLGKAMTAVMSESGSTKNIVASCGSVLEKIAETQGKYAAFNDSIYKSMEAFQQISTKTKEMVNASLRLLEFQIPKISSDALNRMKFTSVVSHCNMPIYFETDTELQELILDICRNSEEKYPQHEIENCVMDYYTDDRIEDLLEYWFSKDWIPEECKEALKQAVASYNIGLYWGTSCILMTQIGGMITQLYDAIDRNMLMPGTKKKEVLSVYSVKNPSSEKAKGIIMINMQRHGIYGWTRFADYFINYVYGTTDDMEHFQFDPGRHKTCHGQQLNLGDKLIALKCILIIDMIVQMSEELLGDNAA